MMVVGPRLGTLLGTLSWGANVCLIGTRIQQVVEDS